MSLHRPALRGEGHFLVQDSLDLPVGRDAVGLLGLRHAEFEQTVVDALRAAGVELVLLAGFDRVVTHTLLAAFPSRVMNIHPALLPAFPGLHTHERALQAGCKLAGATVHFVTPQLDHGPIVLQSVVPVHAADDASALAARVLATEHQIYPRAVRWFVEGRLRVEGGVVTHTGGESQLFSAL